jgi:hypothetical protein
MKTSEHEEQQRIFQTVDLLKGRYPELGLLFAIPNGGLRNIRVAMKLKQEGVRRGIPDIQLAVPNCGYNGLFLELKVGKNKPTTEQKEWLQALEDHGYCARCVNGADEALQTIFWYLGIEGEVLNA